MPRKPKEAVLEEKEKATAKSKKTPVKQSAPKKEVTTKKVATSKKRATVKKAVAPKEEVAIKKTPLTKKSSTVKKEVAPKKTVTTKKVVTPKKEEKTEKVIAKKEVKTKKASTTKKTVATKKVSTPKKETKTEKVTAKKAASAKKEMKTKKASATKKTVSTKKVSTPKKESKTKKATAQKAKTLITTEYYDLPYRYNETTLKVLAQTPSTLFVYWDISDDARQYYENTYGKDFFEATKPVLLVHNKTYDYSFEVDINDFANCWYLHNVDAKCEYLIELGRRPIENRIHLPNNYLQVAYSNSIEAPNNHILFEQNQDIVYYRNMKTDIITSKLKSTLSLLRRMGQIYNIYDLYQKIYKDEDLSKLDNPSSATSSSILKERSK